jgi:ribonuclease HII
MRYLSGVPRRKPHPALFVSDVEDPAIAWSQQLGGPVAGLDEAGRGPLAGPVVAACVVLSNPLPSVLTALNDSKKLDEASRNALAPLIEQHALGFGVAVVEASVIDERNILRASLVAMAEALAACEQRLGLPIVGALLDGNQKAPLPTRVHQRTLVKGDSLSRPIMAASILAKVTRDRRMVDEHGRWPVYGFDVHKGYPTPSHLKALAEHGPCPLHRRSFAPVKAALNARHATDREA